jgi:hypothetical protein
VDRSDLRGSGQHEESPSQLREWVGGRRWEEWLETLAILLLATASLATAWSGFQAAEWGADQSKKYSQASSRRVQANEAATNAHLDIMTDIATFNSYASAYAEDRPELMAFFEGQFSDRLQPAVVAWLATDPLTSEDAPNTPIEMVEYVVPNRLESDRLKNEANQLFEAGVHASTQSAAYVLNTLYLAAVLFFAAIANRVRLRAARVVMLVLGSMFLVYGMYHVITLPVI